MPAVKDTLQLQEYSHADFLLPSEPDIAIKKPKQNHQLKESVNITRKIISVNYTSSI